MEPRSGCCDGFGSSEGSSGEAVIFSCRGQITTRAFWGAAPVARRAASRILSGFHLYSLYHQSI